MAGLTTLARFLPHVQAPAYAPPWTPAALGTPPTSRLAWLVDEIKSAWGATTDQETADACMDFVHRHAIHPYPPFHSPIPSGYGNETLPVGAERADLVAAWPGSKADPLPVGTDAAFYAAFGFDGYSTLCRLLSLDPATGLYDASRLGTSDATGPLGMMERVAAGHWRIYQASGQSTADALAAYLTVLCSYQVFMVLALWASAGLHALHISTDAHDPSVVRVGGQWLYTCPTYGEGFTVSGTRATPQVLVERSYADDLAAITVHKFAVPSWATGTFLRPDLYPNQSYFTDGHGGGVGETTGMRVMGSQLAMRGRWGVGGASQPALALCQVDLPDLATNPDGRYDAFSDTSVYPRVAWADAFPA